MLSLGKRSLWTGSDGDVIRSATTATEDGGDVDVDAAGGDGSEGDVLTASILARSLRNQVSCLRDSPMIRRGEGQTDAI
jgi:hypothetical protein